MRDSAQVLPAASRSRRLLGVFAHPDDEIFCVGGTMAKCAARGVDVTLVSATRGEAGQIRDAAVATRQTLGQVREGELRLGCAHLGVREVLLLPYRDGTLADLPPEELTDRLRSVLRTVDPDVVVTFGEDGAYGHPDHVAISRATTDAWRQLWGSGSEKVVSSKRIYHSDFPRSRLTLTHRLARWLTELEGRFHAPDGYGQALTLFAEEATTLRFASDHIEVVWYPSGSAIVEQGEPATSLYLVLSGTVDVVQEGSAGSCHIRRLGEGAFFGELGVVTGEARSAHVLAVGGVTCLVLSASPRTLYQGRGEVTPPAGPRDEERHRPVGQGATACVHVSDHVEQKVAALQAHHSQFPVDLTLFPRSVIREMFGREHFRQVLPRRPLDDDLFAGLPSPPLSEAGDLFQTEA
jgi:LmbE family N-acetylglucosaminyl deacetylase